MNQLLKGVAVITGAGSGIGKATSIAFARNGVTKLALADIDEAGLKSTEKAVAALNKDVEVLLVTMDVSIEQSVIQGIQQVVIRFGRIDIAVNNAGFGGPIAPSVDISSEDFRRVIDTNMIGLWMCQREEIKQLLRQDVVEVRTGVWSRGIIVNMSSTFGLTAPSQSTPAAPYCTSKHGIIAITKNDANTYSKDGIRINAICPGYVNTDHMRATVSDSEIMRAEMAKVPMRRFAEPEEIADAICFLASPMSSFMSGASLVVDGALPVGALAAIPTFFHPQTEDLDLPSLRTHVKMLAEAGIAGLVVLGSNGEAPHLSRDERVTVTSTVRQTLQDAGLAHIPIIVGASDASVKGTVALCRDALRAGGDFVLVLPPSYFRGAMSRETITDFYTRVADETPLPLLVYSFPAVSAGIEMDSDLIISVSRHPNVVGAKFTCGDTGKLARVARAMDAMTPNTTDPGSGSGYVCYGGLLDFGLMALVAGGSGFIAGGANILPRASVRLCENFRAKEFEKAMELQSILSASDWPHTSAGIAGTKYILERVHGYGGGPRLPLQRMRDEKMQDLWRRMEEGVRLEATFTG
ncbi:uncharacterized protein PV07_05967 [Cladophialophora immunda]|uniref:Dihydrodipicolinate synthase n=1 Tax=Cladophialophora immunda TaxID=569365 RepID=A0A0D2CGF2_9EURO|nr:uncharacterized protein PV07_05967 [Cladophialophora immunda]KIW30208.1 hypothetical protein PV07_05967 [Cladophialophora immunda]